MIVRYFFPCWILLLFVSFCGAEEYSNDALPMVKSIKQMIIDSHPEVLDVESPFLLYPNAVTESAKWKVSSGKNVYYLGERVFSSKNDNYLGNLNVPASRYESCVCSNPVQGVGAVLFNERILYFIDENKSSVARVGELPKTLNAGIQKEAFDIESWSLVYVDRTKVILQAEIDEEFFLVQFDLIKWRIADYILIKRSFHPFYLMSRSSPIIGTCKYDRLGEKGEDDERTQTLLIDLRNGISAQLLPETGFAYCDDEAKALLYVQPRMNEENGDFSINTLYAIRETGKVIKELCLAESVEISEMELECLPQYNVTFLSSNRVYISTKDRFLYFSLINPDGVDSGVLHRDGAAFLSTVSENKVIVEINRRILTIDPFSKLDNKESAIDKERIEVLDNYGSNTFAFVTDMPSQNKFAVLLSGGLLCFYSYDTLQPITRIQRVFSDVDDLRYSWRKNSIILLSEKRNLVLNLDENGLVDKGTKYVWQPMSDEILKECNSSAVCDSRIPEKFFERLRNDSTLFDILGYSDGRLFCVKRSPDGDQLNIIEEDGSSKIQDVSGYILGTGGRKNELIFSREGLGEEAEMFVWHNMGKKALDNLDCISYRSIFNGNAVCYDNTLIDSRKKKRYVVPWETKLFDGLSNGNNLAYRKVGAITVMFKSYYFFVTYKLKEVNIVPADCFDKWIKGWEDLLNG